VIVGAVIYDEFKIMKAKHVPEEISADINIEDIDCTIDVSSLVDIEDVKPRIVETVSANTPSHSWNASDDYLLAKIAMAEAEGEDVEGKAYVMAVILNRVKDKKFPNTIRDVIYARNQFTPISDGRFNRVEPNKECYDALNMIINGWDKSNGALYFESSPNPDNWHSRNLTHLFTHGRHRFYK
jgi:N-acetylmuramoyl-L-alanine amidase